ncbi:hypothetical protein [Frigoriglobus tundricola]|uniref:Uncharacterized protein n=1 Tax=Frigoriglobus tundricola TaxID=2774151 RepID=A0A6M5YSN9_9BACT|nr:hypothetical protein [Frigoriglobus tundricola]QJW96444.1 hypothetical protein FTUN_4001 [Frigoriglobus tundricola]
MSWVWTRGCAGAALDGLLNDLAGHRERLPYALRRGQTIGSGWIEGAA